MEKQTRPSLKVMAEKNTRVVIKNHGGKNVYGADETGKCAQPSVTNIWRETNASSHGFI